MNALDGYLNAILDLLRESDTLFILNGNFLNYFFNYDWMMHNRRLIRPMENKDVALND